jgi:hypothetical protein
MTVPLTIRVTTPAHADALRRFLREVHVDVQRAGHPSLVAATIPDAPTPVHERRELQGYLATWNALNPGKDARLLE